MGHALAAGLRLVWARNYPKNLPVSYSVYEGPCSISIALFSRMLIADYAMFVYSKGEPKRSYTAPILNKYSFSVIGSKTTAIAKIRERCVEVHGNSE